MAVVVRTNVSSLDAQRQLAKTQKESAMTYQRLGSGYRINSSADDAAGLGISEAMNAQIRSFAVAYRNANDAISMVQTADGAAGQIHDIIGRLRELAVQSSNGALQATDRANLDTEFQTLSSEIDRIANVTLFNGVSLLSGVAATVKFQVGINTTASDQVSVLFGGVSAANLGLAASKVDSVANAQLAITAVDAAIQTMSTTRENWGAAMNRMDGAVANIQSMSTNLSAARSRIKDADIAQETADMSRNSVLSQAGAAVLTQANQAPQLALSLLKG